MHGKNVPRVPFSLTKQFTARKHKRIDNPSRFGNLPRRKNDGGINRDELNSL